MTEEKVSIKILGAGRVGIAVSLMLEELNARRDLGWRISLVDNNPDLGLVRDLRDVKVITDEIKSATTVICCLPVSVMRAVKPGMICANHGVNYIDITEDVDLSLMHRTYGAVAESNGSVLMPQCGLAPGIINIAAGSIYRRFADGEENGCLDLFLRVGALPLFPTNSLKYGLTWSLEGLINEYINPCDAIEGWKRVRVPALEDLEELMIAGVHLEAFSTSGGLGSLAQSLKGKVRNLNYKSVRYPGHHHLIKFMLQELALSRKKIEGLLRNTLPQVSDDVVYISVIGKGVVNGQAKHEVWSTAVTGKRGLTALQLTTALGASAMVENIHVNGFSRKGLVLQEDLDLTAVIFGSDINNQWNVF